MAGNEQFDASRPAESARLHGRREGLAVAALALGLVSFLNLLGAEKAILALVLGFAGLSGATDPHVRTRAFLAIGLGIAYLVTIVVVLVMFREQLRELIGLLHTLG